jgi:hypothetical protein
MFVGLMMTDNTAGPCAEQPVVTDVMPGHTADDRAHDAANGRDGG